MDPQIDKVTDSNKECLLIAYVRFIGGKDLRKDLLFYKHETTRATADKLFKITDIYLTGTDLK